jgi:putative transcriptional regulator
VKEKESFNMSQTFETYAGQLLIAMPEMLDSNFSQTVSVICEHSKHGAIGVIINRKHPKLNAKDIFDDIKINCIPKAHDIPVYVGGPAKTRQIFILHGSPFYWKGTVKITSQLAITTSLDVINGIAIGEGPKDYLIALGYAGWEQGQLESEMMSNAWFLAPADEKIIFDTPVDQRWQNAGQLIGINPNLICNVQGTKLC